MADRPLRYVLVGTGGWGAYWCEHVLPRLARLGKAMPAAAADISPAALENARRFLGLDDAHCFTEIDRALDAGPADFAIVVVPPAHHARAIDAALARGLHILCEKPIADTMEACAALYANVKRAGLKMAVTMSHRFDQDKQSLEAAIKSGRYGRLNYVVCRFTHNCRKYGDWGAPFRHEIPDALLIEGAVHHFDVFRALAGANAKEVYTVSWNPPWGEFKGDSTAFVTITMENDVHCFYEGAKANASTMNGWTREYFRAECEHGTLELDARVLRVLRGPAWELPQAESLPLLERDVWMNPWLAEMFCDWVAGRRADHPTSLDDNIHCAALLFAAVESAHGGMPVSVPAYLKRHLAG
jgi:predicted dehydrogenase